MMNGIELYIGVQMERGVGGSGSRSKSSMKRVLNCMSLVTWYKCDVNYIKLSAEEFVPVGFVKRLIYRKIRVKVHVEPPVSKGVEDNRVSG